MTFDRAIIISTEAHAVQINRYGKPYIFHPLRVMMKMHNENERIVAVLHDVIEKSDLTMTNLKEEGFSTDVLEAIDCLTRRESENEQYFDYIKRVLINLMTKIVKLADLSDNSKAVKSSINNKDAKRIGRYQKALEMLK